MIDSPPEQGDGIRRPLGHQAYTVGWICALATESTAAQVFLDQIHERSRARFTNDNNHYVLGSIAGHNVVITVLPDGEYGLSSAAIAATDMLRSYPLIRVVFMVGVGGGAPRLPTYDIRLGDVAVSSPRDGKSGVFQYDFGKTIQDQDFRTTGALSLPPRVVRTAVAALRSDHDLKGHQLDQSVEDVLRANPNLKGRYARPSCNSDRLYRSGVVHPHGSDADCADVCSRGPSDVVQRKPRDHRIIHYGTIASANQVMKDAALRDKLATKHGIICFEMEAAGLMNTFPCLVIRGICDYSDTHKNKHWQGYAAMIAAAYAKDVLKQMIPAELDGEIKLTELTTCE